MRVLLIDADRTGFPNLALMKQSAWHKAKGDEVWLNKPEGMPDLVYISCAFPKNRDKALSIKRWYEAQGIEVKLGGYGVSNNMLSEEIEHICPDYRLYGIRYSMGFTSRGCIRQCEWCLVWKMEGAIREASPLEEFLRHDRAILLDNNFLASPLWAEKLDKLRRWRIKTCFTQGLDLRLVDQEIANMLRKVRCCNPSFEKRMLYFAWDRLEDEDLIFKGIECLKKAGIRLEDVLVYMLVGFKPSRSEDYTEDIFYERDYYRFEKLAEVGVMPYVMVYNDREDVPMLQHFRRWVNLRYYHMGVKWEDYDPKFTFKKLQRGEWGDKYVKLKPSRYPWKGFKRK